MKEFAKHFYCTQRWKDCRDSYMQSKFGLCERCLSNGVMRPAELVHHKIELTPDNIDNPEITLSHDNLMALCRSCHAEIHGYVKKRYKVLPNGNVEVRA